MSSLAIVLLFHGSRSRGAGASEAEICEGVRRTGVARDVRVAHLGGARALEAVLADLAASGARRVVVVPMFVAAGTHASRDVPRLVREARARFANLEVSVTGWLGRHPRLPALVADLVREAAPPRARRPRP